MTMKMRRFQRAVQLFLAVMAIVLAPPALADGRTEINQAVVDAAGGFPYVITAGGNYVLTGHLTVPADTDGLVIQTFDIVRIDMNGFSISSSFVCSGACASGDGSGIARGFSVSHGRSAVVRNGDVYGFADSCVSVAGGSEVTDVSVNNCGGYGIITGGGSVVMRNRTRLTGEAGLYVFNSVYANNVVQQASQAGGSDYAIVGKAAAGGNYCDDKSCSADGRRLFFLTQQTFTGDQALSACPTGFEMASIWELFDIGSLNYDEVRGATEQGSLTPDMGSGPPSDVTPANYRQGWAHTGNQDRNCSDWTSTTGTGSAYFLSSHLSTGSEPPNWDYDRYIAPWRRFNTSSGQSCSSTLRVWCVQSDQ